MEAVATVVVGSKSAEWYERFQLVEAMLAKGFHYVEDTSRQGYGWWCNTRQNIRPVGLSVERYEGARFCLALLDKEVPHGVAS